MITTMLSIAFFEKEEPLHNRWRKRDALNIVISKIKYKRKMDKKKRNQRKRKMRRISGNHKWKIKWKEIKNKKSCRSFFFERFVWNSPRCVTSRKLSRRHLPKKFQAAQPQGHIPHKSWWEKKAQFFGYVPSLKVLA